ncbi:MAG: alginate export family protein [Planctomycetota bacterium]
MTHFRNAVLIMTLLPQFVAAQAATAPAASLTPQPTVHAPAGLVYVVPMQVLPPAQQVVDPANAAVVASQPQAVGTQQPIQPQAPPLGVEGVEQTPVATTTPCINVPACFGQCPPTADGKPSPCAKSHKPLFFDNNFSYLNDPEYTGCCFGDSLKQIGQECGPKLDVGGQLRWRFHSERGMGQQAGALRFQATDNEFLLLRARLYANLELHDKVRLFAEGIYADVAGANAEYVSRGIDENWGDFLNLFADIRLTDDTTVRIGRQELLLGAQRLVSPLDWANTRRTFEGVRVLHKHDNLAIDGFYTNFVPVVDNEIDEANYDLSFYGVYTSRKEEKDTFDLYYLGFDNQTTNFSLHTIGTRLLGGRGDLVYDFEGGAQFGRQSGLGLEHESAYATLGFGRKIKHDWKPVLWFYWDYAAGNNTGGDFNRFNQLFPLAHKYLGFIDAVQRSNVESPNVLLTMQPTKKFKLLFWYYHFMSNQDSDIVPAIGGTPNQAITSKDLGDELDILGIWSLGPRSQLLAGYSRFWIGNKILETTDADFAYVQYQVNF